MPTVSSTAPPDNRHLSAVSSLSRNDSLKSERSDKRVSFNNDVGIKHIPRGVGAKPSAHLSSNQTPPLPKPSKSADEWAGCQPVKLQPNNLTKEQLQKEADTLVDLVDSINCQASPLSKKKHKSFSSQSLDRSQKRNNVKNNVQTNGPNYNRITNPIIKHLKADVNRRENRHRELYSDSDSDRYRAHRHKSVPNLVSAASVAQNNRTLPLSNGIDSGLNYTSVDNLLDEKNVNLTKSINTPKITLNSHHSADNLLDSEPYYHNLIGYKSLGDLPRYSDSDSTDLSSRPRRPNVNQIIQSRIQNSETKNRSTDFSSERDSTSPGRSFTSPTRQNFHNNNPGFNYTETPPVPPARSGRNKSPPKENRNSDDMYAQVNKHGLRQRLSMDSDYSAKIIITEDRPKTMYEGDDEAYETFNVQSNSLRNRKYNDFGVSLSRDDITTKNNTINNNINMSSVAVQTDAVSRALNKARHNKGMAPKPPIESYNDNYRSSRKDLSSDLPSADLVRQINHGFGRFDRSPSPPPRKLMNRPNQRPHIPLLSDTSDSEAEYRRRSDPLAKIRNQVSISDRLQEDQEAEEWEEQEHNRYERNRQNGSYNTSGMRPLTIDEVDQLSLEFDQHGERKLVVSNKSSEKRSSSLQATHHQSNSRESYGERSYSEDRAKPMKPLREKEIANDSKLMTIERNRKNNLEMEKIAQEKKIIQKEPEKLSFKDALKSKTKDKKNKDKDTIKEKKKKRIKIKFFYDPRPQDKPSEDPLSRFTEYKGDDRKDNTDKVRTPKTPRSRSYDSRSQSRERYSVDEVSADPRYTRDSSRERTLSRPDRNRQAGGSTDRIRFSRGNDHSSHDESNDERRRVRSTDTYERSNRTPQFSAPSRDERRSKLGYEQNGTSRREYNSTEDRDRNRDYDNRNGSDRNRYDRYNDSHDSVAEEALKRRSTFLEIRNAYERRDSEVKEKQSFSPKKDATLTRRDSYNDRRDSYPDDHYDRPRRTYRTASPSDESPTREEKYNSSPDDDEKQERVMRQRKKFLSALMTDGRAKSSNNTAPPPVNNTSTLKRSQSSAQRTSRYSSHERDHDSDAPPPPNVTSSANKRAAEATSSAKKQSSNTKKSAQPKKKKKKAWSWGFLGLRGNKRKKGPPSSRGGSEVGSVIGSGGHYRRANNQPLNNSRPTSRASSHRSATRPSVRSSKIRKDAGESTRVWSSKSHDQRETRQWESATLQRPVGSRDGDARSSRDYLNDRQNNRYTGRQVRGGRRVSEGSSGSSAGVPHVERRTSFKQRYFGDSDNEPRKQRTAVGPGDYRSLPNRAGRGGVGKKGTVRVVGGGSAGSSLQSSESENDSHQGSRASHVSTGSNRSVYLHATAVADIPVQKEDSDRPGVQRQTRKVTRSFSLAAPWKPRHGRDGRNYEYDNREGRHAAKPPRPPRKTSDPVNRSHTLTNKDSKLSGWLKKKKNREGKGI